MHVKGRGHEIPEALDILSARYPKGYPFPTLWKAVDGIEAVWNCLPPVDETLFYIDHFRQRAQVRIIARCLEPASSQSLADECIVCLSLYIRRAPR